jgi:hypothetical protein
MDIIHFRTENGQKTVIAGANSSLQTVTHKGRVEIYGVRLMPGAFFGITGVPASEFSGGVCDLSTAETGLKPDTLFTEKYNNENEIYSHLDSTLCGLLPGADSFSSELVEVSHQAEMRHSFLEHYSAKTFNRRMMEKTGISFGSYRKIIRFHKALSMTLSGRHAQADVACIAGYYDQPHLIRDFREFSGCTPLEFIAEIKNSPVRFVQYPLGLF